MHGSFSCMVRMARSVTILERRMWYGLFSNDLVLINAVHDVIP